MTQTLNTCRAALLLAAIVFQGAARSAETPRYSVAPAPDWAQSAVPDTRPTASPQDASRGTEYLLSDLQVHVDEVESEYLHNISRASNASGVNDVANISIDFDPQLDRLILHRVTLQRGEETVDELQHGRIEVLQRESRLESGILDGSLTFHLVMSDVRIGDSVDYSYTIEHRDPAWNNRYFGRYLLQWGEPVRHSRLRIVSHSHTPMLVHNPPHKEPRKADDGTWQSLEWDEENVPAVKFEEGTPEWYEQHPSVQLSQFTSWKEVVDTALPLFTAPGPSSAELATLEKQLTSSASSDAERARSVIRFVQEEIRYTGLELGSGAYRPTPPQEVLQRRYGDCKDKTLLAVTLLRDLGIDAWPALVSTHWGRHLHEKLPSPGNFNHAIVKVRLGSRIYWLDVTRTAQGGGELSQVVQADFGDALVIAPGVKALEEMPREQPETALISSDVEFDLRDGTDKEGGFKVSTVYRGSEADSLRRALRRKSVADIGDTYLNYYKSRYPAIRAVEPPKVTDDLQSNQVTVDESYRVEHLFEEVEKSPDKRFYLEAEIINEHLGALATPVRTTPLDLESPVNSVEHIRVRMPEEFPGKDDAVKVESPQFRYDSHVSHAGNDVILEYHYRTLTDTVPPEALEAFLKKRAAAHDDTYYRFTKDKNAPPSPTERAAAEQQLEKASRLAQGGQLEKTDETLKALLASNGFQALSALQQHAAFYLAGAVAFESDAARALDLLRRSTALEGAGPGDWNLRLLAAERAQDHLDAALSLTTLAERWPENVGEIETRVTGPAVREAPKTGDTRYKLLSALLKANYAPDAFDPSNWWRDLALLQLEHGDRAAAEKTLVKLTSPSALISVRADNRFAPIRSVVTLDIPEAIERETQNSRDAVKKHPTKLLLVVQLMADLRQGLHFTEMIQIADEAINAMNGAQGPKVYDDYRTYRVWLLDGRSEALFSLGKWDEAAAQLVAARQLPESGSVNVSQTINLASQYNDVGKPTEALATLGLLSDENISPYGRMQAAIERLASADQTGDATEAQKQLQFLREHREDSVSTYQRALISANRQDEAAELLISRLQDPDQRIDALLEVQNYKEHLLGQRAAEWSRRWNTVKNRTDVRSAISKVGNVADYPMLSGPH